MTDRAGGDLEVGVLALQGDVREHLHCLTACGLSARPVRHPDELAGLAGIVIPGGESTTMSKLAIHFGVFEPLRDLLAGGLPAYGSCAGMIMLADEVIDGRPDQRSFGGIGMTVRRNAFGRQVDSFEAGVRLAGIPGEEFHAVFIRAPWVETIKDEVEVLGRIEGVSGGQAAAGRIVAVRQGHLLATSFHPELTGDLRVHQLFAGMVRSSKRAAQPQR